MNLGAYFPYLDTDFNLLKAIKIYCTCSKLLEYLYQHDQGQNILKQLPDLDYTNIKFQLHN